MPWVWDERTCRYRDADTGRYLSRSAVLGYVQGSLDAGRTSTASTISGGVNSAGTDLLANLAANGMLSPTDWHEMMREQIKREYIRQYMLGRGGRGSMTAVDWGSIGGMLREQYRYLDDFARLVADGTLSEGQIRARAAMYVNSAREAFERGKARALGIPAGELPAMPGDGSTICLTNCNCDWVHEEVQGEVGDPIGWDSTWTLGPVKTSHCQDCLDRAKKWNPFEIRL